jgi:hypothetical protein
MGFGCKSAAVLRKASFYELPHQGGQLRCVRWKADGALAVLLWVDVAVGDEVNHG